MPQQVALLPWGRLKTTNKLVPVDDVLRGRACDCACPQCGRDLIAVQGERNLHHFRHVTEANCHGGRETGLHAYAKQLILERLECGYPRWHVGPFGRLPVDLGSVIDAGTEIKLIDGKVQADIILEYSNGETVVIEIFVTHRVDRTKLELFVQNNITALEIDLSLHRFADKPSETWPAAILHEAYRYWLNPPESVRKLEQAKRDERLEEQRKRLVRLEWERQQAENNRLEAEKQNHAIKMREASARERREADEAHQHAVAAERAAQDAFLAEQRALKIASERNKVADLARALREQDERESRAPDLQAVVAAHGRWDWVTPEAWAQHDRAIAAWRSRISVRRDREEPITFQPMTPTPPRRCELCDQRARFGYRRSDHMMAVCPDHRIAKWWSDERYY